MEVLIIIGLGLVYFIGCFLSYGMSRYYWYNKYKCLRHPDAYFIEFKSWASWRLNFDSQWNWMLENRDRTGMSIDFIMSWLGVFANLCNNYPNYLGLMFKLPDMPDKEEFRKFIENIK